MPRALFEKKGVYHSELVKAGEVDITITSGSPQKSTFGKDKPDFIGFKYDGEEHTYNVENERCGRALTGFKGQTITIIASGREDDADIEIIDGGRGRVEPEEEPRRQQREPERRRDEPRGRHDDPPPRKSKKEIEAETFAKLLGYAARCGVLMQVSYRAAAHALKQTPGGEKASFEDLRATANTIFIETKSMIDIGSLPTRVPETEAAPKPQERQPEPRRQERDPEPERRDDPPPRQESRRSPEPDLDTEPDDIPF